MPEEKEVVGGRLSAAGETPESAAAPEAETPAPVPTTDNRQPATDYWRSEAKRAFGCRDEARRELAAARDLAEKAAAEAAASTRLLEELCARKLQRLSATARRLVPESLPAAERLRYLIDNEALLAPPPVAAVPGPEKPAGPASDVRAFESLTYAQRAELYRADPERYRRAADAALRRQPVASRGAPRRQLQP